MTHAFSDDYRRITAAHRTRLTALDHLLGPLAFDAPIPHVEEGAEIISVPGAVGVARLSRVAPDSLDASWGKLFSFGLTIRWAGNPSALDALLIRWNRWVQEQPEELLSEDSQVAVSWPSRDVEATKVFLRHGLVPGTRVAIRLRQAEFPRAASGPAVTVRRATPTDIDAIIALGEDEVRYESGLNVVTHRDNYAALSRPGLIRELTTSQPWTWVAQVGRTVVGVLRLDRPEESQFIAPLARRAPLSYLALLSVAAGQRGHGVGAALVHHAHRQLDEAGVESCLLHYGTFNPLSVPFWSRFGYRPLWGQWEATPARTLR